MAKFKALSRGTQLVLVAGPLLFLSLFFTWQNVPVDYGRSGIADVPLDGWDAWGLLLGLLVIATVTLVVLLQLTDMEMSEDVPWSTIDARPRSRRVRCSRRQEPHRRGLVVGELRLRRARRGGRGRCLSRLGRSTQGARAAARAASAAESAQPLDEKHTVLAGAVVVGNHLLDLEAERLVERDRPLVER